MPSFNQRLGTSRYEADALYKEALDAYAKRDYDTAAERLRQAIELLPTRSEYHAALGLVLEQDGALDDAAEAFHEALRLFDYEMLAHYGLGMIAFRRRQYAEAIAHFQKAYFADQKRPETLYYLALSYYHHGDMVNAANYIALAHARFEELGDKRRADSARWVRELERSILKKTPKVAGPATMPLLPSEDETT
ncbi:tetratricopeptide repeat protein [Anaerolineae bacterium CFX9]|jgi:Flp pilus assembly protein TadD|nr:tetratricopeptide repeat protein [Anaerolineae bacterium CFX9]